MASVSDSIKAQFATVTKDVVNIDSRENLGEDLGEDPGEDLGEDSGENSRENSREDPGENSREDLGEEPYINDITYLNDSLSILYTKGASIVAICAYKIDSTCQLPFLKFGLEHKDQLQFPKFTFNPPPMSEKHDAGDGNDPLSTYFKNECYKQITSNTKENIIYKGFVEYEDVIYAVMDCTKADVDMIWGCIDEIVNVPSGQEIRNIKNIPVDIDIYKMLYANPVLLFIKRQSNIEIPQILYLCDSENNVYDATNILKYKMNGEYGYYFYFTSTPLVNENIMNITRVVGFIENAVFDQIGACIYFMKGGIQYWAIKTTQDFTII